MFGVRKLIIFLHIFPTRNAVIDEEIKEMYPIPEDVKQLCPYTSFCEENVANQFPGNNEEMPCCQDCSCDPSCGLHSNCCYKYLDTYNVEETYKMVCRSLYVSKNIPSHLLDKFKIGLEPNFWMINKCLGSVQAMHQVQNTDAFNPVYSLKTNFIYFNEDIANCNNVKDIFRSRKAILCYFKDHQFTAEQGRVIQSEEGSADCVTKFILPEEVNLKSKYCEPEVIHKCNVTGKVTTWEPYWELCGSFNATYILNKSNRNVVYSNIYCFMCNQYYEDSGMPRVSYRCSDPSFVPKNPGMDQSMTMILIPDLRIDVEKEASKSQEGCPVNHAIVHAFTKTCRPIRCPFWKVLVSGKCQFYSDRWIGGPFVVMLRLIPVEEKKVLLSSFLDELSKTRHFGKKAKWLKRKTLKHWEIVSFYHPSSNKSYIESFVVSARWPFISVMPKAIERQVMATLDDIWYVSIGTVNMALKIEFNEFQLYDLVYESLTGEILSPEDIPVLYGLKNITLVGVFVPIAFDRKIHNNEEGSEIARQVTDQGLYHITGDYWYLFESELFITKLFLCRQVDLLPDEYEDNGDTIFFKVKNITIRNFRRVKGIMHNQLSASDNSSTLNETVRLCLEEFQHTITYADAKRLIVSHDVIILTVVYFSVGIQVIGRR